MRDQEKKKRKPGKISKCKMGLYGKAKPADAPEISSFKSETIIDVDNCVKTIKKSVYYYTMKKKYIVT